MQKRRVKPIAAAVGTAFVASLAATAIASAEVNPFAASPLGSGYLLAAEDAEGCCGEGKCGEGKCGSEACRQGGTDDAAADGDGAAEKGGEGKCGEGKCGEGKCGGAA